MRLPQRLALAALAVIWIHVSAPAQAKSYHLERINVLVAVRMDGSMRVVETREIVFRGDFRAFDRTIPLPYGTELANLSVIEGGITYQRSSSEAPGTYMARQMGRETRISWFYEATDETRTFALEYDVLGAVQKHADVAELYWKFIEPRHDWEARESRVAMVLPAGIPASELLVWPHGPLWGTKRVRGNQVLLTCDPLPADETVEARIVFPSHFISSSPRSDNHEVLPHVQAEEKRWAEAADRQRSRAKPRLVLAWGLPALFIVGSITAWLAL
jgi:hypothetical protein